MSNTTLTVSTNSWTDLPEGTLDTMSTTAAFIVSNKDDYPLLIEEAEQLTTAASNYHVTYSRFKQFGGTDNKDLKDIAKAAVYQAHRVTADKLVATANGNRDYITRPGYRIDEQGQGHGSNAKVPAPVVQSAESSGVRGRVRFILKAAIPREVKGVIGRYSLDNGATWVEGTIIQFELSFTLEGQPSGKAVLYQFMFKATNSRKSDWSEVERVEVF